MSEHIECCPFGCKAGMTVYQSIDCEYVICNRCESTGPAAKTREEAIAAWNKRAQPVGEAEPIAWGAFRVGGDRDGQLYAYGNTQHEIETYITQVHQASDNITLRDAPLYAAPPAAANQAGTWQPIETAPMDGTPVLLFARAAFATAPVQVVGWWLYGQHWVACTFAPNKPTVMVPTHWMPLPAAPTESHALGGGDE